jgi:hypothetical protein
MSGCGRPGDPHCARSSARAWLPVVQRAAGGGVHGRHRQPRAGRRARHDRGHRRITRSCCCIIGGLFVLESVSRSSSRCSSSSAPASASSRWRRSTIISSSSAGPRTDGGHPLLDRLDRAGARRPRHAEAAVITWGSHPPFAANAMRCYGLARSGLATVDRRAGRQRRHVVAWDKPRGAREGCAVQGAGRSVEHDASPVYDGVVVSPGVPLNRIR